MIPSVLSYRSSMLSLLVALPASAFCRCTYGDRASQKSIRKDTCVASHSLPLPLLMNGWLNCGIIQSCALAVVVNCVANTPAASNSAGQGLLVYDALRPNDVWQAGQLRLLLQIFASSLQEHSGWSYCSSRCLKVLSVTLAVTSLKGFHRSRGRGGAEVVPGTENFNWHGWLKLNSAACQFLFACPGKAELQAERELCQQESIAVASLEVLL